MGGGEGKLERSPAMLMMIVKIVLAVLLAPVAAFLQVGISTHFWINIILCLLAYFPGMLHALWLVFTDRKA